MGGSRSSRSTFEPDSSVSAETPAPVLAESSCSGGPGHGARRSFNNHGYSGTASQVTPQLGGAPSMQTHPAVRVGFET